jgi:uncharacterized protein YbcI
LSPGDAEQAQRQLVGGELLAQISKMIVSILREHYGRGPMKAKTYVMDDLVVCVLRNGFLAIEETMMAEGRGEDVIDMRHDFQRMMGERYKAEIEKLTGRKVVAFLSQAHLEPDITLEVFFMDEPLPGFGALELVPDAEDEGDAG